MRDPKKYALGCALHWLKRCAELGITAEEVEAEVSKRAASKQQEKEKGKETFPPAPPIEKREKQEKYLISAPRARAREAVVDISRPPTLDELLTFAKSRGYTDEAFIRKWYDKMENELFWRHPKTGRFPSHWVAFFAACYRMRNIGEPTQAAKPRRGVSQTANVHSKEVGTW